MAVLGVLLSVVSVRGHEASGSFQPWDDGLAGAVPVNLRHAAATGIVFPFFRGPATRVWEGPCLLDCSWFVSACFRVHVLAWLAAADHRLQYWCTTTAISG